MSWEEKEKAPMPAHGGGASHGTVSACLPRWRRGRKMESGEIRGAPS